MSTGELISEYAGLLLSAIALCVAILGVRTALKTFENQRTSNDVQLALNIFERINHYWDRSISDADKRAYYVGQILAYYEVSATLFNRGAMAEDAACILKDHIVEMWAKMLESESSRALIENVKSSSTTFSEMEKFFRSHLPKSLADKTFRENSRS